MHQEENRKRRLARSRRADALAPDVECNVTLFGPVLRTPDRPVARLRRPRARGLRLRGEGGHEPRPDAEACSLEDGAARKRVIERQRAFGHGVLRVRRECAAYRMATRGARPSWAAPGSARDLIRSPKTAKAGQRLAEHIPARPSQPAAVQALARLRAVC